MTHQEAIEWLSGTRSMECAIPEAPIDTYAVRVAQADAAMIVTAFFILKAHADGLIPQYPTLIEGIWEDILSYKEYYLSKKSFYKYYNNIIYQKPFCKEYDY